MAGGGYHVVKKALGTSVSLGRLLIQSVCDVFNLKRKILAEDIQMDKDEQRHTQVFFC